MTIDSTLGVGTRVSISLPTADPPIWFVGSLCIEPGTKIVALDDDISIHQLWKGKIETMGGKASDFFGFTSGRSFKEWYGQNQNEKMLLLFDHELLDQDQSGLDIIDELRLRNAILVTSRYEEDQVRERCLQLGVQIIPKGMAAIFPMKLA